MTSSCGKQPMLYKKKNADSWIHLMQYTTSLQSFNGNSDLVVDFLTPVQNHTYTQNEKAQPLVKYYKAAVKLQSLAVSQGSALKALHFYTVLLSCQSQKADKLTACLEFNFTLKYPCNVFAGQNVSGTVLQYNLVLL